MLIEYPTLSEAKAAIEGANGEQLLEQTISVDFAFVRKPSSGAGRNAGARKSGTERTRSRSPGVKEGARDEDGD